MDNFEGNGIKEDLLTEETAYGQTYTYAETWQRFVSWLVDNLLINYGLGYVTGMLIGSILIAIAPDFYAGIDWEQNSISLFLLAYIVGVLNYTIYYTLLEKLFRGYTLGKLISGTRAIRQDGDELTFKDALLRSLSRTVPFEVFSGFSTLTWHDRWTNTMVIKAR